MIFGRSDFVFSGDDDLEVVVSLPLAFCRFIVAGVSAYESSWTDDTGETVEPDSDQISLIELGISRLTEAINEEAVMGGGMIWLNSGLTVYNSSGTTTGPAQVQVLKSVYPDIADAAGVVMVVKSSVDQPTLMTSFKYGSALNQIIKTLPAGDNLYDQLVVPCDETGFRVNLQVFDQTYWNYQFIINGYWT